MSSLYRLGSNRADFSLSSELSATGLLPFGEELSLVITKFRLRNGSCLRPQECLGFDAPTGRTRRPCDARDWDDAIAGESFQSEADGIAAISLHLDRDTDQLAVYTV